MDGAGPSGPGWREEIVRFPGGSGHELVGVLTRPVSSTPNLQPSTAVVVVHGWGTCRSGPHRMLVELCRELASRAGRPSLRFDLAGRGDSGGDFWEIDLDAMIAAARAAGERLLSATGAQSLAAAGLCSGANVALGAAAADPRFSAVAALSALPFQKQRRAAQAAARGRSTLRELLAKALSAETWRRLLRGEVALGRIWRRLVRGEGGISSRSQNNSGPDRRARNLKDSRRDIQAELAAYRGRLLFIHGGADAEGLSGWRDVLGPALKTSPVRHRQLAILGADHDYHGREAKRRAIDETIAFLTESDAETRGRGDAGTRRAQDPGLKPSY